MENKHLIKSFKMAFPKTIPVLIGFMFLGMAYGVIMSVKGFGFPWPVLLSMLGFCGSMQYLAITLLAAGTIDPLSTFFITLMVNARHLFYGVSMLDKYRGTGIIKPFLIFTMCDETFSILCAEELDSSVNKKEYYFFVSLLNYLYWIAGTFLGCVVGNFITFNTLGLDFVLTALFIVIFLEQWLSHKKHIPALIGIFSTLICLIVFGKNIFVVASMIVILISDTILYKKTGYSEV